MEHRQLRYFVTPVEELHFGGAATREHIVQSPLSQQLQRLERKLGILLLDRTTHHVQLTPAESALLVEARQILEHVNRAVLAAQRAGSSTPVLRVGVVDPSYDSMPQILRQKQEKYPELEIHQVEAGAPEQFRQLASGRLNVGIGRASLVAGSCVRDRCRRGGRRHGHPPPAVPADSPARPGQRAHLRGHLPRPRRPGLRLHFRLAP